MDWLIFIFGQQGGLNAAQMGARTVIIFIYTLVLIRLAGRRSFGLNASFDNILVILLGAILSRAVTGASPFYPTLFAGFVLSLLHRLWGILCVYFPVFGTLTKGQRILISLNGEINKSNMVRSLVSENDIKEAVRTNLHQETYDGIETIYMERNGTISFIKSKKS